MASALYDKIYGSMKEAMRAKDQQKVLLLRGVIAAVKNSTVNAGKELTDEVTLSAVKKSLKEVEQSIESFTKAERGNEVKKLKQDKAALEAFLPEQLSEAELKLVVEAAVKKLGASSKKDMGRVMKEVMSEANGAADGKLVSKLVAAALS